jgi:hypothetical protein
MDKIKAALQTPIGAATATAVAVASSYKLYTLAKRFLTPPVYTELHGGQLVAEVLKEHGMLR